MERPILQAVNITKVFPGVRALDGVSIDVYPGRVHAVVGENGAGKSTLMNILAGVLKPDSGQIYIDGQPVCFSSPKDAQQAGIAIIFQELSVIDVLSVAENIYLGREPLKAVGLIDRDKLNSMAASILARLDPGIKPDELVGNLRVAQQQIVEIARALSINARVIIMDEPTSALTAQETRALFDLIYDLKRQGVAIIYITHRMEELQELADDITVLRDGKRVATGPASEFTIQKLIQLMIGRDLEDSFKFVSRATKKLIFTAKNINLRDPQRHYKKIVDDVSFELHAGEVLGIFGLLGARRTELLETIFGLHPRFGSGDLCIDGRWFFPRCPREAIEAGLALAPEDRKGAGLVLEMSVCENTTLAVLDQFTRIGLINRKAEEEVTTGFVKRMGIKTPSIYQKVRNLSGGTQQKVVLAKWLSTKPKVLLLDEPTRGIDVNARREIYQLIGEFAASGMGIVLVSSDLPEVMVLSDRIMVMCEGRKTAEFSACEATAEKIMEAALP